MPVVASFGGGLNSTAMLIGMVKRGDPVHLVLFADTGGERPATYEHTAAFSQWLLDHGIPVAWTRWYRMMGEDKGKFVSLEQTSLERKELPSLAYGFKGCSTKWKRQPLDRAVKAWPDAQAAWARGEKVTRLLGFDADEAYRADRERGCKRFNYRYPLLEWDWDREECAKVVREAGFGCVPKSSCFFCPALKLAEIIAMRNHEPDLYERAIAIEDNAVTRQEDRGLGGSKRKWRDIVKRTDTQTSFLPPPPPPTCGCYDG